MGEREATESGSSTQFQVSRGNLTRGNRTFANAQCSVHCIRKRNVGGESWNQGNTQQNYRWWGLIYCQHNTNRQWATIMDKSRQHLKLKLGHLWHPCHMTRRWQVTSVHAMANDKDARDGSHNLCQGSNLWHPWHRKMCATTCSDKGANHGTRILCQ